MGYKIQKYAVKKVKTLLVLNRRTKFQVTIIELLRFRNPNSYGNNHKKFKIDKTILICSN